VKTSNNAKNENAYQSQRNNRFSTDSVVREYGSIFFHDQLLHVVTSLTFWKDGDNVIWPDGEWGLHLKMRCVAVLQCSEQLRGLTHKYMHARNSVEVTSTMISRKAMRSQKQLLFFFDDHCHGMVEVLIKWNLTTAKQRSRNSQHHHITII